MAICFVSPDFQTSHVRKVHRESWKSGLSRISSKYRRFTFFNHRVGEIPASCPYPTALFGVILRQLHTREQSHTESMLLSAGVSFPCLTLKYRRFTVFNHRVGELLLFISIRRRHLANSLFNLFHNSSCTQSTPRVLEIGAFAHLIQISPFYLFQS